MIRPWNVFLSLHLECFYLFSSCLKETRSEKASFHLRIHSPDAHNSSIWGTRSSTQSSQGAGSPVARTGARGCWVRSTGGMCDQVTQAVLSTSALELGEECQPDEAVFPAEQPRRGSRPSIPFQCIPL